MKRVAIRFLVAIFSCGLQLGCAETHVHVINDLTNEPVAGATLSPVTQNLLGIHDDVSPVDTDVRGRAALPYGALREATSLRHPTLRLVKPSDRATTDGSDWLLYLRRPPRIVLVLPDGFKGVVLIEPSDGSVARDATYRIPVTQDLFTPTAIPGLRVLGLNEELVWSEEIEAEQAGHAILPGTESVDPAAVHLWALGGSGISFEHRPGNLLFVGTRREFLTMIDALPKTMCAVPPRVVDRQLLQRLQATTK